MDGVLRKNGPGQNPVIKVFYMRTHIWILTILRTAFPAAYVQIDDPLNWLKNMFHMYHRIKIILDTV